MTNVLSLFDGISCGQIALNRVGIKYDNYFASEIDKYAITVTQHNYPNTIQLGSVVDVKGSELPQIDLLIGGSPCTDFSIAGSNIGMTTIEKMEVTTLAQYLQLKNDGFQFKGQSYLFWEYVRLLHEVKPKYFLLENVKMAKKWKDVISNALGVQPIEINSKLVSAQNRSRLYWTNIEITLPTPKNIIIADIIDINNHYYNKDGYIINIISKNIQSSTSIKMIGGISKSHSDVKFSQGNRIYSIYGKSPTLVANSGGTAGHGNIWISADITSKKIRKLTTIECERLQTIPNNYTNIISSNTQRHKMIGNGWTVDIIAHILKGIIEPYKRHDFF